ncbi:DUF1028 domain-containing protein [Bradyrhizobium sp. U87765 SZCCT0131]|uniref:DUF1028 domain-containing protein n=1 Tax=unclassified Bradyrhizobium TaxID=2631580 RepID=UPI001BADBECC|nr:MULTISPECIES: DUF1028 domain-containing protein [unclassified Bradyrhizobium]MBR1220228.1 DUF1028 domain-containing protein [Bradyrhizobium sp. U87765 SZCCT0131]MBR1263316.1 DUF1028 domain-containing protein [Bradyrhizobium sp. U87765 SZCCT0134]MBR1306801.1 DUF1028 domain-containing protein [Bradyrhizobium sp. U87765 SZCCT0110]MBR1323300.1 DUF1028 domain-containing protein [Bradyrhizobium sp. U87765 SZCCT0109]MBR1345755.1 DUF1028 domain-containing protein [Bradyrhizobium sp. U87765 SZCCT004
MTWSIIARDHATGHLAIAGATRFFAVGARVPFIASGVGAIATQALLNSFYGVEGLALLRQGLAPAEVVAQLTASDGGRDYRQLHMIDATGRMAAHTGAACVGWCGHCTAEGFSIAGNMLAGPEVIDTTAATFAAAAALPLAQRLIAAMRAGEAAGGDRRGRQSAALLLHGDEPWSDLDLRVDDHEDPLAELARLEQVSRERWVHFRRFLPRSGDRVGETDRTIIEAGIARSRAEEG